MSFLVHLLAMPIWSSRFFPAVLLMLMWVLMTACRAVTDPRNGRRVAIKKLPNVFHSLVSCKRVYRELKMLCTFQHENVRVIYCVPFCVTVCIFLFHRGRSWIERRHGSRATRNLYSIACVGKVYIASALLNCRGFCVCFSGQARH